MYSKRFTVPICCYLTLVTILLSSLSVLAQPPEDEKPCPHKKDHHPFMKELNLSEEQRAELKEIREKDKPFRKKHREEMKAIRQKAKEELLKDNPDRKVLKKYSQEIAQLHEKMSEQMIDHLLKVKKILTKEQFEKILSKEFKHGMFKHKMQKKHKKGPRGPHKEE